jgi:LPS sulfotransferase NodH
LETSGIAGRPTEVFSPEFQGIWRKRWGLSESAGFSEYLQAAERHGTTSNGVYGLKIHWMHVSELADQACFAGDCDEILAHLFPGSRFVHVVRRDRRAQALSYYRALVTNEWWRIEGIDNDQSRSARPVFHADTILALESELARQDEGWQQYFRERRLRPLVVEYEALSRDYQRQVARVLSFLGLDPSVARLLPPPRLVRQSDALTSRWRRLLDDVSSRRMTEHDAAP